MSVDLTSHEYTAGIAAALRLDYGDGPSMVKSICQDTGASMGTVKNWLAEVERTWRRAPHQAHGGFPTVRAFVDRVISRDDIATKAEARLRRALAIMEGREEP